MDNAIYGSAKAWVDFNAVGGTVSIRASYNISSITRVSTGDYQINLINAVTDANFSFACSGCQNESPAYTGLAIGAAPASSSQLRATYRKFDNTSIDPLYASAVIFTDKETKMPQAIVFTTENGNVAVCIPTGELPINEVLAG